MRRPLAALPSALALLMVLAGCVLAPSSSPTASPTPDASPPPTPSATAAPTGTAEPTASATPEPALSLDLPDETDDRVVVVEVEPSVGADGGEIVVTVTSRAGDMVEELVLRWPRALNQTLFLRPFEPSEQRIADGGPPLVQPWTKWVLGPGEEGEPAGTVSLGWGPLFAGATLTIPIDVVRREVGPVAFDLQVLSENAILADPDGDPVEIRVEVP